MTASLDQSYEVLSEGAARLYRRLSLHPGAAFGMEVVEAVAATTPTIDHVSDCLMDLVDANLLSSPEPEQLRFHDVIHQHARGRAESDETGGQRRESITRIIDCYLSSANAADHILYPQRRRPRVEYTYPDSPRVNFTDTTSALEWFDRERGNLLAVQRMAENSGLDTETWQLAEAMWTLFIHLRYHDDWISSHELGVTAAVRCRHPVAEARLRTGLGIALRDAGRPKDALREFTSALSLRREIGDRRGEGLVLHNIGLTHRRLGDWGKARSILQTAISVREEAGDTRGTARGFAALGEVESLTGHHESALAYLTLAREALINTGDPYEALTERLVGEAHLRAGDVQAARRHLTAALEVLREAGEAFESGAIYEALGTLAQRENDTASARRFYTRAEAVYARLNAERDARRVADLRGSLGAGTDR
ncbi:tetratricopeptide repeat protein [Streptomyces sp. NPDC021225]|uniref:tetratricopeptide repeat protein n=1 Tax=Streptomyces sp. NPDC021225 TaxID=3365121 RepID=UPI0037A529E4